jgi:hypothetical protein
VQGGGTVTTTCPTGMAYSTAFLLNESPISEGGRWGYNLSGAAQTPVRSESLGGVRVAHGTQSGHKAPPYDDSSAYLTGFGSNYEVEATIWKAASQTGGSGIYKEFEILLRWLDTYATRSTQYGNTNVNGYEIQVAYDGSYCNLGRFKGDNLVGPISMPMPATGDKYRARIEGQRIRMWWNDVLKIDFTDSDATLKIATGNPGIGFWANGAPSNEIGYSSVTVTAL